MFASHPETQDRLDALNSVIAGKLTASATVAARYHASVSIQAGGRGRDRHGSGALAHAREAIRRQQVRAGWTHRARQREIGNQTVASAGSRGVNPDRDAKGGPIKTIVVITVTAAEIAEFKQGIAG